MDTAVFHGLDAIVLENDCLRVTVLPALGAKTASIRYKPRGFELACQSARPRFELPHFGDDFERFDVSGCDDLFPTIDACTTDAGGRVFPCPDHGELWSAPFSSRAEGETLVLTHTGAGLPFRYEKRVSLQGTELVCRITAENTGCDAFAALWAFHGLMRWEPDLRLVYPEGTERFENVFESPALGRAGRLWDRSSAGYDFGGVRLPDGQAVKYYAAAPVREGFCGYDYPSQGVSCRLEWDAAVLPYLGFWLCCGALGGLYHCAFEPSNGYYDNLPTALARGRCPVLAPGRPLQFELRLRLGGLG